MSETTQQPKRTRSFRFSLRTFLIVVILLSAWIGWYVYRAEGQKKSVQWVLENGGSVWYDYQESDEMWSSKKIENALGPEWLRNIVGVDYFSSVVMVRFSDPQIRDLEPLAGLRRLVKLQFTMGFVSGHGVLSPIHDGFNIRDLKPLAGLTNLEELELNFTEVADLTPISGLTKLKLLDLSNTPVKDLKPLAALTILEELKLESTEVEDLNPLAALTNLEELELRSTEVDDLTPISGLTKLKGLHLSYTPIIDLKPLAGMKNLVSLSIHHRVADLTPLFGLTKLRELWVWEEYISDEDVRKLKQALPNCVIKHLYSPVGFLEKPSRLRGAHETSASVA